MSTGHLLCIPETIITLIRKMHPRLKRKVRAALDEIIHDPGSGKSLKLELAGLRSYHVGRFRIIYKIGSGKVVELVAVGPRKTIYEETYRLIANLERDR